LVALFLEEFNGLFVGHFPGMHLDANYEPRVAQQGIL
jgi:hypothetical protein